jgi:Cof subfamily protein (haloacid dehalogenase superfamily)
MAEIRMVCLDLDGTTLNSKHEVTDRTRSILQKVDELGIQIALVTGRSKGSTAHYAGLLNLSKPTPVVCYNGSFGFMIDPTTGKEDVLFQSAIQPDQARILLDFAARLGLVAQYYNGITGDVYAKPLTDEHRNQLGLYEELTGKAQVLVDSYDECMALSPSAKLLVLTNDAEWLLEMAEKELPAGMFQVIRGSPHSFFCEFLLPETGNKGAGLKRLCECMKLTPDACVAFGDGENDKEMLTTAGIGCAMKNARPAAKAAANVVIDWTNDEDGVACHLEKMIADGSLKRI